MSCGMLNSRAMPIVTFLELSLAFGNDQIISHANLNIDAGDRIAVTGRNGAGKSTLLKLISGDQKEDEGSVWRAESLTFATLSQNLPARSEQTVFDAVAQSFASIGGLLAEYHRLSHSLDEENSNLDRLAQLQEDLDRHDGWAINHRIEATLDRLDLDADATLASLSGGWLKRIAIAQSLVVEPDVWILDEPTNHLDLQGINWLEDKLLSFPGTILFVTHDRRLMKSIATSIVEIDRGHVTHWSCGYDDFLVRRDEARATEEEHNKKFDDKLKKEEVWIRQGIKARRTRNEGRVRALQKLRSERAKRVSGKEVKLTIDSGISSGKIVKEAINVSKSIDGTLIISDLNLIIQRGDRIGLLGPNGCGKTTLLKLLLEHEPIDEGVIKTGTKLEVAYFDQIRDQLDPDQSVMDYITEGREFVTINGKDLHFVSYLSNFLFSPDQSRAAIRTLSGGEQNRLLLARLFSMPANFLVLDEPTNDLDVETLELLEELLVDYDGTVLLVSHDREFMDNVVSSLLVFEGNGRVQEYVGGFSDWVVESGSNGSKQKSAKTADSSDYQARKTAKSNERKRMREIERVTDQIERTESKLGALHGQLGDPVFFQSSAPEQQAAYDRVAELEAQLVKFHTHWEELESTG